MAQVVAGRGSSQLGLPGAGKTRVGAVSGPTRPRRCLRALAWGITLQLAAAAAAAQPLDDYINPDRPGIADGSNVVGTGHIQVETGLQREYRSSNGAQSRTLFLPTVGQGSAHRGRKPDLADEGRAAVLPPARQRP